MASWGWFFVAALVYNLAFLIGYRAGYKEGAWDAVMGRVKE